MAGWFPAFQVLVAFNNAVFDDPALITSVAAPAGTLGAHNVWTDVTPWVRDNVDTNRGKQHEVDRFQPGSMTCTFDNRDGRFDPWNTAGPYTGLMLPGKPVRLRATDPNTSTVSNLFTGISDVWTTVWDQPRRGNVQLACVDWFAYLTNAYLATSIYPRTVLADSPVTYLRLSDPVGATHAADSSGNNHPASPAGTVLFGQTGALPVDTATACDLANGGTTPAGYLKLSTAGGLTGTAWTIECWYKTSSWTYGVTPPPNILYYQVDAGLAYVQIYVTPAGILTLLDAAPGTGSIDLDVTSNTAIPADGNWHHLAVTSTSPFAFIDGQPIAVTAVGGTGVAAKTVAAAWVGSQGVGPVWPGMLEDVALYNTALSSTRVLAHFNAVGVPVETSGARVARAAGWVQVPTANATIDTGKSLVQVATQPLTTTVALSYLQLVEQTEQGALFVDGNGQIRFQSRDTVYATVTPTQTFGDGGGSEIPFELGPTIATDTQDTYITVTLQRNGGNPQTADSGQLGKVYSQSGLLQTGDTEVLGQANWLLGQFAITPRPRIRGVTIHPVVTPTGAATTAILSLELGAVVTVNRHTLPGAGTAFTQVDNVEGINHHIYPATADWTVDLQLTPLAPERPWILGTSQLGVDTNLFF